MMMKNKTQKSMISISIMLLLVIGCFVAVPQMASATDNGLRIEKTVNGVPFNDWLAGFPADKQAEILNSISFELCEATSINGVKAYANPVADGIIDADGDIYFSNLPPQVRSGSNWYAVVENFEPNSLAEELFTRADPLYVYLHNGDITDFDYDAFYTIVNGWYADCPKLNYVSEISHLNNGGEFFPIGVTNVATGRIHDSFCAHAGSRLFAGDNGHGCEGYMVASDYSTVENADIADFISALNYIEDTIGDLNDNRIVTQTVIWALLGAVDVESSAWDAVTITQDEKADVERVLANYKDYTGNNKIVDVVYLLCHLHGDSEEGLTWCQPQFVPVYGDPVFNNKASPFVVPEYGLAGLAALATCFAALLVFYATKNRTKARTYNTSAIQTGL